MHERKSHEEAVNAFGEYSLFVLMWTVHDLDEGLVTRCSRCQSIGGKTSDASAMIFDSFKSPVEGQCSNCYGTTFEGGWKAKLIRPAMWDYAEEKWDKTARGYITNNSGSVQSTADFFMRDDDYIFRADGTRWKVSGAQPGRIIDGFGHPSRADNNLGLNYTSVVRENESAPSFKIPPLTRTELTELLDVVGRHHAVDYRSFDEIRGPIRPESNDFEPQDYRPLDHHPGPPDAGS